MKNLVALIGKPNVGKSTLFNRIIGARKSIVHDQPGVTRDRLYQKAIWKNKEFYLIDTGGITDEKKEFADDIKKQAQVAINEANVVVFVVDGLKEISKEDLFVVNLLRKANKKIIVAINKMENNKKFDLSIYTLGIEELVSISALHGEGTGELMDLIFKNLHWKEEKSNNLFKLSIIGKPNVGKSSLLNKLTNQERSIVSNIPGTTRDSVNAVIKINDEEFEIIDTAGINRKSKLVESVEHYALNRAFSSLEESDLTLLVIDATNELSHFDARIAGYAMEYYKPIIIVVNKWDLIVKNNNSTSEFTKRIRKEFKFLSWAPIIFISTIEKQRISKLKDLIIQTRKNINIKVKTSLLNEVILDAQQMQPAPSIKGKKLNISYIKQLEGKIPTFLLIVNDKKLVHFTYQRYLEKQLREHFNFSGTPINLIFKNKNE